MILFVVVLVLVYVEENEIVVTMFVAWVAEFQLGVHSVGIAQEGNWIA